MDPPASEANTTGKATLAGTGAPRSRHRLVKDALIAGGLAMGLIAAILAIGCFRYGDFPSFVSAIRGDDVFVGLQELTERADGKSTHFVFNVRIKNLTMRS